MASKDNFFWRNRSSIIIIATFLETLESKITYRNHISQMDHIIHAIG